MSVENDGLQEQQEPPSPKPAPARDGAWRRLARAAVPRSTKAQVLGAFLTVSLGFAIATQVQQTQEGGLDAMRQDDLVRVLDDVSQRSTRLDQQASELQAQRDQLAAGAGSSQAAIDQAKRRLDTLRLLAGTVPAHGPGIRMTIVDPSRQVTAPILLDVLQELRDAGAEVIQFGGTRIVAGSWFGATGTDLQVDGQPLTRPLVVLAVGDAQTMASAMSIPGGIVETIRRQGATATVEQIDPVTVDAVASPRTPRYAQPVPETATPTP